MRDLTWLHDAGVLIPFNKKNGEMFEPSSGGDVGREPDDEAGACVVPLGPLPALRSAGRPHPRR